IPVRSGGTFANWQGLIPGHTSQTLWSKTHPYQDLPRVLDPPSGWLQNANDPPWSTTLPQPLNPKNYPAYFAPPGPISLRAQRSIQLLTTDPKLSLETMVAYKHSTRMALADRLLDDLIPAAQQSGNALARQAAAVLARWDRNANADSRGAVLFNNWFEAMDSDTLFARPWTPSAPLTTPDGLADPKAAVHTLERVARTLRDRSGSLDIAWGNVFRFRSPTEERPANGGYGDLGIFRTIDFAADDAGGYRAVGGDSFVAAIEFSNPVSAKVLLGYGNVTQPDVSGSSTQFAEMESKRLRKALRSRSDIEQHLASSERLNPQF
ncbi:MAG TPA: penicillin acylase family protein, partial [Stenomitos sp.]